MRILLLAHPYLNLYIDIVNELREQGHRVTIIEESKIPGDPYHKNQNKLKRKILIYKWEINKVSEKYWLNKFKLSILNQEYDLLFVIQGCTFNPILLEHLKKINPNIKSSLYIWDTNKIYDFYRNVRYFDKVFSFDLNDVNSDKNKKMQYLPFFWPKQIINYDELPIKYKISSIGTNHDDRYFIYKKIITVLKKDNIPFYIKLILFPTKISIKDKVKLLFYFIYKRKTKFELLNLKHGVIKPDFVRYVYYESDELCKIIAQSEAVLDTDNELQFGTTPRIIWALALNKHIYTTNRNIKMFPFFNEEFIHIIDRNEPNLDWSLMNNINKNDSRKAVMEYRIDNWVQNFL